MFSSFTPALLIEPPGDLELFQGQLRLAHASFTVLSTSIDANSSLLINFLVFITHYFFWTSVLKQSIYHKQFHDKKSLQRGRDRCIK